MALPFYGWNFVSPTPLLTYTSFLHHQACLLLSKRNLSPHLQGIHRSVVIFQADPPLMKISMNSIVVRRSLNSGNAAVRRGPTLVHTASPHPTVATQLNSCQSLEAGGHLQINVNARRKKEASKQPVSGK